MRQRRICLVCHKAVRRGAGMALPTGTVHSKCFSALRTIRQPEAVDFKRQPAHDAE
jgi:hypothetical protein